MMDEADYGVARARSALYAIDANCDRETWVRVGMAAQEAGLTVEDFDAWSSAAQNYRGERDTGATWRSFRLGGGIGPGTLYAIARKHGWSGLFNERRANLDHRQQVPSRTSGFDFAAVWRDADPATADHPYVECKLGSPVGLRVYRGPIRVAGEAIDGALLVPLFSPSGDLQSWQAILRSGKKLNAPGVAIAGGSFMVGGSPRSDGSLYVVEGIGQAWSAHIATRDPAVVAFGAGNIERVATDIRNRYPAVRIIIVADTGKESAAEKSANAVGGSWIEMPGGSPANFDLNDLHRRDGLQAVESLLAQARKPDPRFHFATIGEVLRTPVPSWRVLRVIPERGLIVLWGASGSGKTFAALDMTASIARGRPWAGRRTCRGCVAYIAAEGQLRDRIDAYLQHNALSEADLDGLRVLDSAVNLLDPDADIKQLLADLRALALETKGIAMVVIDTLNRVMPGGDENSSRDMGMVIAAAKMIEQELECAVLFVHHSGKDETKGSRGHSSLKAAADAEISIKRERDIRIITAEKVRDGADGELLMAFHLRAVDLGAMADIDPHAEPNERRTSCVIEPTEAAFLPARSIRLSDIDAIALRVFKALCGETNDRTETTSLHRAGLPRVAIDHWRERFRIERGVDKSDSRAMEASKKAFQRAVDKLAKHRIVGVFEAKAWLL